MSLLGKPVVWGPLVVLLLAVEIFLLWQVFEYGRKEGGYYAGQSVQETERINRLMDEQAQAITECRNQSVSCQRAYQIEKKANREIQKEVVSLRNQLASVQNEADLYRSLLSENKVSLYIKKFVLRQQPAKDRYSYSFFLMQALEESESTKGTLKISVHGNQEGASRKLTRKEFSVDGVDVVKLEFKHYQKVAGEMVLPTGFVPENILIEAFPKGRAGKKMTRKLPWAPENY